MISYPIRGLYREHFMRFELASDEDANKILELYHSVLDTPYCRWSMEYPLIENIEDDLSRKGLFCLKEKAEIIAAISIDEDDAVAALPCWSNNLQPSIELSRLCVRSDYQGKGLAGKMIEYPLSILHVFEKYVSCFTVPYKTSLFLSKNSFGQSCTSIIILVISSC